MKNKILAIFILLMIISGAYLLLAHHYIYREISRAGLGSTDRQGTYLIGKNPAGAKNLVYSALGDSLTSGVGTLNYEQSYPYLLAEDIANAGSGLTLINRSYPGARTADLVNNLLPAAIADNPDIVTILIGVNDIHGFVSKTNFKNNYQTIITGLKKNTHARIYAISIPFIGTDSLLLPPYNYYFRSETIGYNKIIEDLARVNRITYIDLYTPTVNMGRQSGPLNASDRFHPSAAGYKIWAEIIYDKLNR